MAGDKLVLQAWHCLWSMTGEVLGASGVRQVAVAATTWLREGSLHSAATTPAFEQGHWILCNDMHKCQDKDRAKLV
jgi:hypothetical protein